MAQVSKDDADSPVIQQFHLLLKWHLLPSIEFTSCIRPHCLEHILLLVLIGLEQVLGGRLIISQIDDGLGLDYSFGIDLLHDATNSLVIVFLFLNLGFLFD